MIICRWFLIRIFQRKVVEKIKIFLNKNFLSENCLLYEIVWKNTVELGRRIELHISGFDITNLIDLRRFD